MIVKNLINLKKKLKKKNLELHTPFFQNIDYKYTNEAIKSSFVSTQSGKFLKYFKNEILRITKSKYTILLNSGSSAIFLALRSINLRKNEEVLLPTLNYIANANAVKSLNAIPHFIDSDMNNLGIDIQKLKTYLKKSFKVVKKKLLILNQVIQFLA